MIAGDAFVMLEEALRSLDALAGLDAGTALTGHGPVWKGTMEEAVAQARAAGPS